MAGSDAAVLECRSNGSGIASVVDRSTTGPHAIDGMETGWTEEHSRGVELSPGDENHHLVKVRTLLSGYARTSTARGRRWLRCWHHIERNRHVWRWPVPTRRSLDSLGLRNNEQVVSFLRTESSPRQFIRGHYGRSTPPRLHLELVRAPDRVDERAAAVEAAGWEVSIWEPATTSDDDLQESSHVATG